MNFPRVIFFALIGGCCGVAVAAESSEKPDTKGIAFFESKIRPVLAENCYRCHSAQTGKSEGNLLLDSRKSIRAGGDRGPAVVPGKPDKSILLDAVNHSDPDLKMPPRKPQLPASVRADFVAWIQMGAPDPRDAATTKTVAIDLEAGRKFWAFKKPLKSPPPHPRDAAWARSDIDRFVLAKLEAANLKPSPDADPATLLRRLWFDLVGLPPGPADIERFLDRVKSEGLDAALSPEVDALLASKSFGERWGRHWLDVARFAESSGKEANISFPYAWRYRDYVIDCFAQDKPFDRFITEQIAGDLLPYDNDAERARLLIATGYLAVGPKNLDEGDPKQFWADLADEQIDATSRGVLAMSVACARCHDHKFDPFAMEDYYALAGIFRSSKTFFGTFVSPSNRMAGDPLLLPHLPGEQILQESIPAARVKQLKADLAKLKQEAEEMQAATNEALRTGIPPKKQVTLTEVLRNFWVSGGIKGQLDKVDDQGHALPLTMGMLDDKIADAKLMERGDVHRPATTVARAFPRVVELHDPPKILPTESGRLELARWLTHPDNPLTARVMANRVWRHLLGAGIVRTVDNFGTTGERPSHPELLDYLAVEFTSNGWSTKRLVREIVLSRTYRQASTYDEQAFRADPDNRLLWRANKRRLDAEAIRDGMLAVSGELDLSRPVGSLVGKKIGDRPISLVGLDTSIPADLDGSLHRSVYLPVLRDRLPDALDLFDFAEPSLVTGDRDTTNVPLQALYLMNSPFVQARAHGFARRLELEAKSQDEQVRLAFLLCYGRPPGEDEMKLTSAYLAEALSKAGDGPDARFKVLSSYCQALLATAEFRNLD